MKPKTHQAAAKRFIITKKGKVLHRTAGQDHFNTREPGKVSRNKRRPQHLSPSFHRTVKILVN